MKRRFIAEESGQALVELSSVAVILCVLSLGIVDVGRAFYDVQVIKNLAGEGSSLASRGTNMTTVAGNVVSYAGSALDLGHKGCVLVTEVTNDAGTLAVTSQTSQCAITAGSKVGCVQGTRNCQSSTPTLPSEASSALLSEPSGSSLFVTEVFYSYTAATPLPAFLNSSVIPSQIYAVAYY